MKKLCAVLLMAFATSAFADAPAKYNQYCIACHASGVAGAPKTGDVDAWKARLEKGMDVLVKSSTEGLGAMPPKALCNDCTADDYKALIEYMSAPAK